MAASFIVTAFDDSQRIDISPEELHETGLRENAGFVRRWNAIREAVEFEGDLPAFSNTCEPIPSSTLKRRSS